MLHITDTSNNRSRQFYHTATRFSSPECEAASQQTKQGEAFITLIEICPILNLQRFANYVAGPVVAKHCNAGTALSRHN